MPSRTRTETTGKEKADPRPSGWSPKVSDEDAEWSESRLVPDSVLLLIFVVLLGFIGLWLVQRPLKRWASRLRVGAIKDWLFQGYEQMLVAQLSWVHAVLERPSSTGSAEDTNTLIDARI